MKKHKWQVGYNSINIHGGSVFITDITNDEPDVFIQVMPEDLEALSRVLMSAAEMIKKQSNVRRKDHYEEDAEE